MYPQAPNFRSSDGGAAWAILGYATPPSTLGGELPPDDSSSMEILFAHLPTTQENKGIMDRAWPGESVVVSQWDAILRVFQHKAREMLGPTWSFDLARARCTGGTPRTSTDLAATGMWDAVTAEALGALACRTSPREVSTLIAALPTLDKPIFDQVVVKAILAYAFVIDHVGTPDQPEIDEEQATRAKGIRLPSTATLPSLASPVHSPESDPAWFAIYKPASDPAPTPPRDTAHPASPNAASRSAVGTVLVLAGVAGVGYLVWSAFKDSSASPRRKKR